MLDQCGAGLRLPTATETLQAAFEILIEVALDGASGDAGVGGDLVMAQAVALEPEGLDLALDAGLGVMVAIMGQGLAVVCGEDDVTHDKPRRFSLQVADRQ